MLGKRDCYGQDKSQVVASLEGGLSVTRPVGGARGQSVIVCLTSINPGKILGLRDVEQVLVSTVAVECFTSGVHGDCPYTISECTLPGSDMHAML